MKKIFLLAIGIWLVIVGISFLWNINSAGEEQRHITIQTAHTLLTQIILTREWNSGHGGVYVSVNADMRPNPWLDDPLRDIQVNDTLLLTKVNPSFMTRQLSEIAEKYQGAHFHLTSLKPLRPQNSPTEWEKKALELFEQGAKEACEFTKNNSNTDFIYMVPLKADTSCLTCHSSKNHKVGDIIGGISVTLSDIHKLDLMPIIIGHIAIGAMGVLFLIFFGTKLSSAYDTIQRQTVTDSLTGIPNRRYFSERFYKELNQCRRENNLISVIMCDIDNFKAYNDLYGHQAGDECIKRIAQELEKAINRPSDFCARYGGDEFIVILPDTPADGAMLIAEKIRKNIEGLNIEHDHSKNSGKLTISLGVSTADPERMFPDTLIKKADDALYRAKKNGRNRVENGNK
jgi:diguanylate cyclase (GGDEF)-like protein